MILSPSYIALLNVFPNNCEVPKHFEHLSNKARILKTTKATKLIVNFDMGFLNKLIGKGTEETDWLQLESEDAVEEVFAASGARVQLILKHSESCAVSFFAKQNLDSVPLVEWSEMDRSMVEVVRFRPISQYIAKKTSVRHESPQVLVIANGEVLFYTSHSEVNKVNIQQAYEKAIALL